MATRTAVMAVPWQCRTDRGTIQKEHARVISKPLTPDTWIHKFGRFPLDLRTSSKYILTPTMPAREHHYALDAASLLFACRRRLRAVLEEDQTRQRLAELDVALHSTERLLHFHLLALVESYERRNSLRSLLSDERDGDDGSSADTLMGTVARLECLIERSRQRQLQRSAQQQKSRSRQNNQNPLQRGGAPSVAGRHGSYGRQHQTNDHFRQGINSHFPMDLSVGQYAGDSSSSYASAAVASGTSRTPGGGGSFGTKTRSPEDSLLFTLLVHLQLCMVRIEEADVVVCGYEKANRRSEQALLSEAKQDVAASTGEDDGGEHQISSSWRRPNAVVLGLLAGLGAGIVVSRREKAQQSDFGQQRRILSTAAKVTGGVVAASYVRRGWRILGINARLTHTTTALEDWQHQWVLVTSIGSGAGSQQQPGDSSQLLELIEKQGSKSLVWHSYSALRFLLIKRTMDLLYASVGAALEMTKGRSTDDSTEKKPASRIWMPIATAAAATYYNVLGPSKKSAQIVSSSSQDFVKNAWGVVSLPAVKNLSLQASRILKGAAIADRIEIAGVPCVVLSSALCPRKSFHAHCFFLFARMLRRQSILLTHFSSLCT